MGKCFFCKKDIIDQESHTDCATSASVISLREPDSYSIAEESSSSKGKESAEGKEIENVDYKGVIS
jgi:hypothetical protein